VKASGKASGGSSQAYRYDTAGLSKGLNSKEVGALTGLAGAGLILGAMVLIGVVNSMASGRAFRFPGF
jgi:hypothetical protein